MSKKYTIERSEGCCLPDKTQKLLLKAALGLCNDIVGSYQTWRTLIVFDDLDSGSYRLLPLFSSSFNDSGIDDELFDKIKGVYRLHWAKNNLLFNAAAPLLRAFHENNIPTMVLKGAVLAKNYYSHIGLRPMDDVDIMVRPDQALLAQDILMNAGWSPVYPRTGIHPGIDKNYMLVTNSCGFRDNKNMQIDLHWEILSDCLGKDSSETLWKRAEALDFHGVETLKLDPTDQFFQVIVHGVRWNPVPSFRWIADALMMLKNQDEQINWVRLFETAKENDVLLLIREACEYLVSEYGANIPLGMIPEELMPPPTTSQVKVLSARLEPQTGAGFAGRATSLWHRHRSLRGYKSFFIGDLLSWPEFLKNWWGARSIWELPLIGIGKMSRWKNGKATKT